MFSLYKISEGFYLRSG